MQSRPSFYRDVHKGIRSFMLDLLVKAGRVEWNDSASVAAFRGDVEVIFELLKGHARHEDDFVAPMLRKASPEVAAILDSSHDDQEEQLDAMLEALRGIDPASSDAPLAGHAILLTLARFVGESLVHMSDEEEVAMPAIHDAFDDAAIIETHGRLVAAVPPQEMDRMLRWMLPAMNNAERAGMLTGMRQSAPPPVFAFVRGLATEVLSEEQNAALAESLMEASYA